VPKVFSKDWDPEVNTTRCAAIALIDTTVHVLLRLAKRLFQADENVIVAIALLA